MLPTHPDNIKKRKQIDDQFWAKHKDQALERFNAWILG